MGEGHLHSRQARRTSYSETIPAESAGTAPQEVQAKYHRASIVADEIRIVKHAAAQHNVVFVLGHAHAVLPKDLKFWQLPRRLLLEMPYKVRRSPLCACQWCCHDVCAWSSTVPA
jgi:hypothetical protein